MCIRDRAWTFVLWGIYHAGLLIAHRMITVYGVRNGEGIQEMVPGWLAAFGMFHLTCLGWMFFRAESAQHVFLMLKAIVFDFVPAGSSFALLGSVLGLSATLFAVQAAQYLRGTSDVLRNTPVALHGIVYGVLFYLMAMHGGVSESFIYFQF